MQHGRHKKLGLLLASLLLVAIAVVTPYAPAPLVTVKEKSCADRIVSAECLRRGIVATNCCRPLGLGHSVHFCHEVEEWQHRIDKTTHFTNPQFCVDEGIACIPYDNHCD